MTRSILMPIYTEQDTYTLRNKGDITISISLYISSTIYVQIPRVNYMCVITPMISV